MVFSIRYLGKADVPEERNTAEDPVVVLLEEVTLQILGKGGDEAMLFGKVELLLKVDGFVNIVANLPVKLLGNLTFL